MFRETTWNFIKAFETKGYKICKDGRLKRGIEKIAIYAIGDNPTHAARQLESGTWISKCGDLEDIKHPELSPLEGKSYGEVKVFMHRRRDGKRFVSDRIRLLIGAFLKRFVPLGRT